MTVEKAIEVADGLRPNNDIDSELKKLWLAQADAGLRKNIVNKSDTEDFDSVGADRSSEANTELIAPDPWSDYYPHYLAARIDAALGETTRYANEMLMANEASDEFALYCRKTYAPKAKTRWKY